MWDYLVGNTFVIAYSSGIVAWAILQLARLSWKQRLLIRELKTATTLLTAEDGEARDDEARDDQARTHFAQDYARINGELRKNEILGPTWKEFTESLIHPAPDTEGRRSSEPYRNTRDPGQYFTLQAVVLPKLNLRFFDSMPGQLTGLGILGTFVGLAAGIGLAQSGLQSQDISEVQTALQQLLAGASLAFTTSIAGLITSILFLLRERSGVGSVREALQEWVAALDSALHRITPEQLAEEQLKELRRQTADLQNFNTELAVSISAALDEALAKRLSPALEKLITATEGLRADQQAASQDMLEDVVSRFGETMSGAAGQEFAAISESLKGLDTALKTSAEALRAQEERSSGAIRHLTEVMSMTLTESSGQIRSDFTHAMESMLDSVERMAQRLQTETDAAARRASDAALATTEKIGAGVTYALDSAGTRFQETTDRSAEALATASQSIREQFGQTGELLTSRARDLAETLERAGTLTLRMNSAAETIREAAGGMTDSVGAFNAIVPVLREASTAMAQASTGITKASDRIEEFGSRAAETTTTISDIHERLRTSWADYVTRFEGTDEALAQVFANLESGLTGFASKINEFMGQLDENLGTSMSHLVGAVQELEETIEMFLEVREQHHG